MSYVYAIGDESGYVKFGRTKGLAGRLETLQTGNRERLAVLGSVEVNDVDAIDLERHIHDCLADLGVRVRGEWFAPSIFTTLVMASMALGCGDSVAQVVFNALNYCAPRYQWFWSTSPELRAAASASK